MSAELEVAEPKQIDIASINSMEEAEKFVSSVDMATLDALMNGGIPTDTIPKPAEEPGEKPLGTPPVEEPKEPPPEEKKEEETSEPAEGELTDEILQSANPALLKEYQALLEKVVEFESAPPAAPDKHADDPIIKMRRAALESGHVEIPLDDFDFRLDKDKVMPLLEKLYAEPDDEKAATLLQEHVVPQIQREVAARAMATIEMRLKQEQAIGEARAEFRSELSNLVEKAQEFNTPGEKLFVTENGNKVLNKNHKAAEFVNWVVESAKRGLLQDDHVREFGMEWVYNTWKSKMAGGVGNYMAQVRKSAAQESLERIRKLKDKQLSSAQAPVVGVRNANGGAGQTFHGYPLQDLMSNPDTARKAFDHWTATGNQVAMNEFGKYLNP